MFVKFRTLSVALLRPNSQPVHRIRLPFSMVFESPLMENKSVCITNFKTRVIQMFNERKRPHLYLNSVLITYDK